jgi:hypothetical protein
VAVAFKEQALHWERLPLLRAACDVRIDSYLAPGSVLRWRMTVRGRGAGNSPPIVTDAREISEAVREAVALAEQAGLLPMPAAAAGPEPGRG